MTFAPTLFSFLFSEKNARETALSTDFSKSPYVCFLNTFNLFFGVCEVNKINNFQL